jgi:hypothetical protein
MRKQSIATVALIPLFVLLHLSVNAAQKAADSSGLTIHQTTQISSGNRRGGDETNNTVIYIGPNAIKTSNSDGTDEISHLEESATILVDNNNKSYSILTFQEATAAANAAELRNVTGGAEVKVIKNGPGESIAGYATEKYSCAAAKYMKVGTMQIDVWAAPGFGLLSSYYDLSIMGRPPGEPMSKIYEQMKNMGGIILKQVTIMKVMGKETKTSTVVTSVEKGPIPQSTFERPVGYKLVNSSDFWQNKFKTKTK